MKKGKYFNTVFFIRYCIALVGLLLAFFYAPEGSASSFRPIITNFSASNYNGGLQSWALEQGTNGEMYVGNNLGLLCFDGFTWTHSEMPTCQTVRAVFVDGKRIYVGSYEEFGYFESDTNGVLQYTSLSKMLKKAKMLEDEIWNIIKIGHNIYFQSFSSWFKYDGKTVTQHHDSKNAPLYFHSVHGKIYVQMINGDFYRLVNDKYIPVFSRNAFGNDNVVAIIPTAGGKMILCTEWNGLYNFDGKSLTKIHTSIDADLQRQQVNRATLVPSDSTIVIGTILNGIYALSPKGELRWHYNVNNGLHNNSILRLLCDKANNVWAATDNGVALIHTGSPYTILTPEKSESSIGMVYDIDFSNNKMYLATNQGVYTYDGGTFGMVQNTHGQNWHITNIGQQLLVGNNSQTKTIVGNQALPISRTQGSSTCIVNCKINEQDILLETSYSALRVYRHIGSEWVLSHEVKGFGAPIRQLQVDQSGTIWAAHMSKGIYKIQLSKDLTQVVKSELIDELKPNGKQGTMSVMKIRGRVVFSDGTGLYTYDDMSHKIVPMTELNKVVTSPVISASPIYDDMFWLAGNSDYIMVKYNPNGTYSIVNMVSTSFLGAECNEMSNAVITHNNSSYFFINNGIAQCSVNSSLFQKKENIKLMVAEVSTVDKSLKHVLLPIVTDEGNPAESSQGISFRLSYPYYGASPLKFHFHLTGSGADLKSASPTPQVTYSALGYGHYTLKADVTDSEGNILSSTTYYFNVVSPLYLSIFAFIFYIVVLFTIGYFIARWRAGKIMEKKRKEFEAEKLKQDLKMLEQENIIAQQQQQILESELSSKGKEIASLALDMVAKDKVIESFRESLQQQRNSLSKDSLRTLMGKLNSSSDNREFWDIYQKNFDLIHENFFRNLRTRYPSLTSSDLKFCALLRLNLTSKEISQFTNLTVRGVEAARYRLRKKFNLPEGTHLIDFLIDFK